jgi:RNA polymerase-binding transcription factor
LIRGCPAHDAMMGAMDADRARELLAAERTRLEQALVGRGHTDVGELSEQDEPADQATELYQDEFDEGLAEDIREQLAAVGRAEARLEAGTYGVSVLSGEPIPDERLEAVPTAELTVAEEEQRRGRPA